MSTVAILFSWWGAITVCVWHFIVRRITLQPLEHRPVLIGLGLSLYWLVNVDLPRLWQTTQHVTRSDVLAWIACSVFTAIPVVIVIYSVCWLCLKLWRVIVLDKP